MFWGLVVDPGKRYHQTVEHSFHVSIAALDLSDDYTAIVQLMLTSEKKNYLLCTLNKHHPQYNLDLNFQSGEKIAFSCSGNGSIHLTGYLVPEDDPSDSSDYDDDEEIPELVSFENMKRKKEVSEGPQKKKKKVLEQTLDEPSVSDESDDSDDDDSDQYEDVEEEEEEPQANGKMEVEKKKKKKKKKDKSKQNESENESRSPTKEEKNKKDVTTQQQKNQGKAATPLKKKLEGGVIIEDLKTGNGSVAKPGKMVQVYYEGRLKSNNKVFDSSKQGRGFQFRLGRQEVIKGWDVALVGMRVGGKRKIICPPNMAYGAKGSPPVIPSNSTLVFEVELKNVN